MATIKIRDLEEGMTLARDVLDRNGRLIVSAGENITGKHLRMFKAWGVTEAGVEGSNGPGKTEGNVPENFWEKVPTEVRKHVEELFRYADKQHPAVAELMELCALRKMEPV
ncbi:MAG: hypothetical protein NPINA01_28450 [Nitrospinaceae bacterium]|nr:MAG: hypothetical protein NPINA01_28450 [Nitrospinaceae bacterium]